FSRDWSSDVCSSDLFSRGSRAAARRTDPARGSRLQASGAPWARIDAGRGDVELAQVLDPLVEAPRALAPKLDAVAPEPIAAPERRARHGPGRHRIVLGRAAELGRLR